MAALDDTGEYFRCDRCGEEYRWDDDTYPSLNEFSLFVKALYLNRVGPVLPDFCLTCIPEVSPLVAVLRDVDYLRTEVRYLERAINERRNKDKNHGAA